MDISELIEQFFLIFNNRSKTVPSLAKASELFIPEVTISRYQDETDSCEIMDLQSFLIPRLEMLQDNTLTDFAEWQTEQSTKKFGKIAQYFCHYEKSGNLNGQPYAGSGTKLFHLIKTKQGWKISAILWHDYS